MMTRVFKAIAFVAAFMFVFASCEKQPQIQNGDTDTITSDVFTASIVNLKTAVTIDGNAGKVAWVKGDEITVTDAAGNSAIYEASESGASVEFALAEGETAVGAGPYKAVYNGDTPALEQTYVAGEVPSITMTAESQTKSLAFNVTSGLLKLTLSGEESLNISSVMVKGDETDLYVLSCESAVDISSAKEFYVALPAGDFKKIYLTGSDGKTCIVSRKDGTVAIAANTIQPVVLTGLTADKFDGIYLGTSADSGYPLLWAEKNVGATTLQETGAYMSWGNTALTWLNGVKTSGSTNMSTENYQKTTGYSLSADISPDSGNDAARVNMGGSWRLPTTDEASALVKLAVSYVAGTGYTIEGNGNSIFVPVASFVKDTKKQTSNNAGEYSYFWTNHFAKSGYADAIQLRPDGGHKVYWGTTYYGFNIRGVKE